MVLPSTPKPRPFFSFWLCLAGVPSTGFWGGQRRLGWLSLSLSTPDNPTRVFLSKLRGLRRLGGHWPLRELPQASGPQLICPDRRPCHRSRTQRARVFDLESNASPSSGAVPAPWVSAGAARSPQDFDGLERATLRARPPPAIPSPTPGPAPKPKPGDPAPRRAGREAAVPNSWGAAAPGAPGAAAANRRRPARPLPSPAPTPGPRGKGTERGRAVLATCLPASAAGGTERELKPRGVPHPRPLRRAPARSPASACGRAPRRPYPRPSRDIYLISKRKIYL